MKGKNATVVLVNFLSLASGLATSTNDLKRILVTGANKGIGKAICQRLLTEWEDTHVILGSRDTARGKQAVEDLIQQGCPADRLELLHIDTSNDESVEKAAASLGDTNLFGIINNAGIMGRDGSFTTEEVMNVNYFGVRRVNDAFVGMLQRPGGRIVNISSAGGPNYVSRLSKIDPLYTKLGKPWTIDGGISELDEIAKKMEGDSYGASKALVNAYTVLQAKRDTDLIVNSVTPGWIMTDMTKGSTASGTVEKGAVPPCWLMMNEEIAKEPTGRYYGSDCVRSPLHFYRGPGDAPYVSDKDLMIDFAKSVDKTCSMDDTEDPKSY